MKEYTEALKRPLIVYFNIIDGKQLNKINVNKLTLEVENNAVFNPEELITILQNNLLKGFKIVYFETPNNLAKIEPHSQNKENKSYIPEITAWLVEDRNIYENDTSHFGETDILTRNNLKMTENRLFKSQSFEAIPTAAVLFSSVKCQIKKEYWIKDQNGLAYLQYKAKGNYQNYIEHYITSPGDITLLPWDEALQIIEKFGFTSAKLHLIFAAYAMKQEKAWESQFILNASNLIKEMGWDRRTDIAKHKKLLEIANIAFALDCLLVKAVWIEGKNKKGGIDASTPIGRMWNITIVPQGEINMFGIIEEPEEIQLIIQPGAWTKHFLNKAGNRSKEALYQFGYLAQQVLTIDSYHNELALRLAIYLTLNSRVRLNGKYKVEELLEDAIHQSVLQSIRSKRRKAYNLKQRWDNALKLLIKLGWQIEFDPETYPEWLKPEIKDNMPKGYLEKLLDARLIIKPPAPIPELLTSKLEPIQTKAKPNPQRGAEITNSQVRELRIAKRWTQAQLAGFLGVSQKYISLIERGDRSINSELAVKLRKLLE